MKIVNEGERKINDSRTYPIIFKLRVRLMFLEAKELFMQFARRFLFAAIVSHLNDVITRLEKFGLIIVDFWVIDNCTKTVDLETVSSLWFFCFENLQT